MDVVAGLLSSKDPFRNRSLCAFYTPKIVYILLYFIVALALYSVIVFRQQQDPLYDWCVPWCGGGVID